MRIHDASYLHQREIDKFRWIHNMTKGDYLKSAHRSKLIKSRFGINHLTLFFSVENFKLGFLYLNFPKIDCKILVKFAYKLKSLNSLLFILNRLIQMVYLFFLLKNYVPGILFIFYKEETSIVQYNLKGKKHKIIMTTIISITTLKLGWV